MRYMVIFEFFMQHFQTAIQRYYTNFCIFMVSKSVLTCAQFIRSSLYFSLLSKLSELNKNILIRNTYTHQKSDQEDIVLEMRIKQEINMTSPATEVFVRVSWNQHETHSINSKYLSTFLALWQIFVLKCITIHLTLKVPKLRLQMQLPLALFLPMVLSFSHT